MKYLRKEEGKLLAFILLPSLPPLSQFTRNFQVHGLVVVANEKGRSTVSFWDWEKSRFVNGRGWSCKDLWDLNRLWSSNRNRSNHPSLISLERGQFFGHLSFQLLRSVSHFLLKLTLKFLLLLQSPLSFPVCALRFLSALHALVVVDFKGRNDLRHPTNQVADHQRHDEDRQTEQRPQEDSESKKIISTFDK